MALLAVEDVTRRFGGIVALADVSLALDQGEIVGLIGPNGAGKTTLFNVVSGVLGAHGGTIRFDGEDITTDPAHRRAARGIGRSFQHLGLMLDETAEFNVLTALHRSASYSGVDVVVRPWRYRRGERDLRSRRFRKNELRNAI